MPWYWAPPSGSTCAGEPQLVEEGVPGNERGAVLQPRGLEGEELARAGGGHRHGEAEGPPGLRSDESLRDSADRKSTRLNSSHVEISYAVFCLKKKKKKKDGENWKV